MSSPALALTPVPLSGGTGAGAITAAVRLTATVITRCVRTRMENGRAGIRGASQALHRPGAPYFPHSFHYPRRLPASGWGRT